MLVASLATGPVLGGFKWRLGVDYLAECPRETPSLLLSCTLRVLLIAQLEAAVTLLVSWRL